MRMRLWHAGPLSERALREDAGLHPAGVHNCHMNESELTGLAEDIATLAGRGSRTVAVAESLTSGQVATHLGAASEASEWFRGAIVAYAPSVKFEVLGVTPGPVVTASCARQMVRGVARLLDADLAVAITGVGGPGSEEGRPPGTVFIAVHGTGGTRCQEFHFDGDPADVVSASTSAAMTLLAEAMREEVSL